NCPICGMKLQPVEDESAAAPTGSGRTIAFYRHPMRPEVTSPVPAKDEMGMDYVPVYTDELQGGKSGTGAPPPSAAPPAPAPFTPSPARQQLIGVRRARVERRPLTVAIRAVGTVAYDPGLYQAVVEYRQALRAREQLAQSTVPEALSGADGLVRAAAVKLRQKGISESQPAQGARGTGDPINLLLPRKSVWGDAQGYQSQLG